MEMKTCKLTAEERYERRLDIMEKRDAAVTAHRHAGRSFIQSRTTRKVFGKTRTGKVVISHDQRPYPHSSERQRARYARQIAAGQLRMETVAPKSAPVKARTRRAKVAADV